VPVIVINIHIILDLDGDPTATCRYGLVGGVWKSQKVRFVIYSFISYMCVTYWTAIKFINEWTCYLQMPGGRHLVPVIGANVFLFPLLELLNYLNYINWITWSKSGRHIGRILLLRAAWSLDLPDEVRQRADFSARSVSAPRCMNWICATDVYKRLSGWNAVDLLRR